MAVHYSPVSRNTCFIVAAGLTPNGTYLTGNYTYVVVIKYNYPASIQRLRVVDFSQLFGKTCGFMGRLKPTTLNISF